MRNILVVLLSFFVIALFPLSVHAQDTAGTSTPTPAKTTNPRVQAKDAMQEAKDEMMEKTSEARDAFKERIKEIQDAAKQTILEKIVDRINSNNQNKTMKMSERLERLTSILTKVSEMATDLAENDVNVTTLNRLITAANTAIETAKESVSEQMEKEYLVDITTDSALRTNARATIQEYITDIKAVFQDVVAAHRAVVQAFSTAKSLTTPEDATLDSSIDEE